MVTKMQNKESIMCTHLNLIWTEGAQNIQQFGMSSPKISWVKVKLVQVYLVIWHSAEQPIFDSVYQALAISGFDKR